jgi:hypothetical protein
MVETRIDGMQYLGKRKSTSKYGVMVLSWTLGPV